MIKITEFKNHLQDIVKPNRFLVSIQTPKAYPHNVNLSDMRYFVQAAQIPARNSGELVIKYHGMELRLPGDATNDELTLTFLNNPDWIPRDFFEQWMNIIQNIPIDGKNIRIDARDALEGAFLIVEQIGASEDRVLARYKFFNVFPKSVAASELNMDSGDQAQTFTVSFSYSHWERI